MLKKLLTSKGTICLVFILLFFYPQKYTSLFRISHSIIHLESHLQQLHAVYLNATVIFHIVSSSLGMHVNAKQREATVKSYMHFS